MGRVGVGGRSSRPRAVTCRELVDEITDYLERRLPAAEVRRLERHLFACEGCRRYVSQLLATVSAVRALRPGGDAGAARASLLALFRHATRSEPPEPPGGDPPGPRRP